MNTHRLVSLSLLLWAASVMAVNGAELAPSPAVMTATTTAIAAPAVIPAPALEQADSRRFNSLSDAAFFYLGLAQRQQWKAMPRGPLLKVGDRHPHIPQLRQLLTLYGDYAAEQNSDLLLFDSSLKQALIGFQTRHGAKADGILGPQTRAILNISPRHRAYQIALNLERQATFSGRHQSRYIQVNIPEYRLRYFDQGSLVLAMKTIIGRRTRQTPVLESQIRSVVINPSWNVPRSIAYKDILPRWREDDEYLQKHNLKVVSGWAGSWQEYPAEQVDQGKLYRGKEYLRFYQPPGDSNALGRVKFMFPNPHAVYLHDTPKRSLFAEANRAFSSGCIRLEKPLVLAQTLMNQSPAINGSILDYWLNEKRTKQIRLKEPVPLYLTYWTAWLDQDQVLHFGEDVYRQDRLEASSKML